MNTDEQEIRNVIAEWHRATAKGEVDTILGLMSEDVVFLGCARPPMKGRSAFETGLRELLETNRIDSTGDVQECEVSGDLAYCWTQLKVSITPLAGGAAHVRSGSALSIFRKVNGKWQMVRDANLLGPAK